MSTLQGISKIVTNGLVMYLDAGNPTSYVSGSTTWSDLSGNRNSGSLVNGPTFNTANQGSIVFDGVDDYCQTTSNPISNNSSFTLACWVYITLLDSTYKPLIDCGNLGVGNLGYTLSINNSNRVFIAANTGYVEVTPALTANTWCYLVGTATSGTPYNLNVYINGTLGTVAASGSTNTLTNNYSYIRLGQNNFGVLRYTGRVANTQIYNRALSAQEVAQNYNVHKARFGIR